jgi:hypothetical protein
MTLLRGATPQFSLAGYIPSVSKRTGSASKPPSSVRSQSRFEQTLSGIISTLVSAVRSIQSVEQIVERGSLDFIADLVEADLLGVDQAHRIWRQRAERANDVEISAC